MEDLSAFSAKPRLRLLLDHFAKIKDTRQACKVAYPLREVLFLVVCGTIANGDDYDDIVDWGKAHLSFPRGLLLTPDYQYLSLLDCKTTHREKQHESPVFRATAKTGQRYFLALLSLLAAGIGVSTAKKRKKRESSQGRSAEKPA